MDVLNLLILVLVLGPILVLTAWSWVMATEAVEELEALEPAQRLAQGHDAAVP